MLGEYYYDSLDVLPIKLFFKIAKTQDTSLLSSKKKKGLDELWEKLCEEYEEKFGNAKLRQIENQITQNSIKFNMIQHAVYSLGFKKDDEVIAILRGHGYKIDEKSYQEDIKRIGEESKALKLKIERLKRKLPKGETDYSNIDKVMAGFSSVLGFDFDYNTISVTKYFAIQDQVKDKLKAMRNGTNNKK